MTFVHDNAGAGDGRFLSQLDCLALAKRVFGFAARGGHTDIYLESVWTGNVRAARNRLTTCGDVRTNEIGIARTVEGARALAWTNEVSTIQLEWTTRRAERMLQQLPERPMPELYPPFQEPYQEPVLWFDRTYQLQSAERAEAMQTLVKSAESAGLLAAAYIEVSARGRAVMSEQKPALYFPLTQAHCSVTVRDSAGTASGWAGGDENDWSRMDVVHLAATALEKCQRSRNPVAIEPGRYVAVLEPQAVADLVSPMLSDEVMSRINAETGRPVPFRGKQKGWSKIGLQVIDSRITIGADPMDPDGGFVPYSRYGDIYHPVNWIVDGILKELAYSRVNYGIPWLGKNAGLSNSGAFRMSGGTATVDSMIANTKRGVLVTRFSHLTIIDKESLLMTGVTRDGLWLIENGKLSKAVKNFIITESPLIVLNNVLELGVPQRVVRSEAPAVVPALRVQDFSFTGMTDAV